MTAGSTGDATDPPGEDRQGTQSRAGGTARLLGTLVLPVLLMAAFDAYQHFTHRAAVETAESRVDAVATARRQLAIGVVRSFPANEDELRETYARLSAGDGGDSVACEDYNRDAARFNTNLQWVVSQGSDWLDERLGAGTALVLQAREATREADYFTFFIDTPAFDLLDELLEEASDIQRYGQALGAYVGAGLPEPMPFLDDGSCPLGGP